MYRVILQMTVVWNVQNFFKADESTTARVHNMWGSVPICMQFGATYTPVMFELSEHTELVDPEWSTTYHHIIHYISIIQ